MIRQILIALAGSAALAAPAAHADPVYWSLNVGVPGVVSSFSNAYPAPPVVYAPPPVVYAPPPALPPVYFRPPRPVAYGYAPVVVGPGYMERRWDHREWHRGWRRDDDDRRDWDRH
jgi:hypothetical protein